MDRSNQRSGSDRKHSTGLGVIPVRLLGTQNEHVSTCMEPYLTVATTLNESRGNQKERPHRTDRSDAMMCPHDRRDHRRELSGHVPVAHTDSRRLSIADGW